MEQLSACFCSDRAEHRAMAEFYLVGDVNGGDGHEDVGCEQGFLLASFSFTGLVDQFLCG